MQTACARWLYIATKKDRFIRDVGPSSQKSAAGGQQNGALSCHVMRDIGRDVVYYRVV